MLHPLDRFIRFILGAGVGLLGLLVILASGYLAILPDNKLPGALRGNGDILALICLAQVLLGCLLFWPSWILLRASFTGKLKEHPDLEDAVPAGRKHLDLIIENHEYNAPQTYASNPGMLEVNISYYLKCYHPWGNWLLWSLTILIPLAIAAASWLFTHAPKDPMKTSQSVAAILGGITMPLGFAFTYIRQIRDKFRNGDIVPGIVVGDDLVAVRANLSKDENQYPAVKILRQPLSRSCHRPPAIYDRVAAIATYKEGDPESPHWRDFYPQVVQCCTKNEKEIERVFQSIPQGEWDALERCLQRLPDKTAIGLHLLFEE
ncbi:DUF3239 domain-containing protein [Candidatus Sumerlaeota bacterium]|nr:DUF3239 domain-containing protein [Candidatus Sumerlaeota bacterium]